MEFIGYDAYGTVDILLGMTAVAMSIALFLYPLPTMWRILRQQSTAELQPYPYKAIEMASYVWMIYAGPIKGSKFRFHNHYLLLVNEIGVGFQLFYVYTFRFFTTETNRSIINCFGTGELLLFFIVPALLGYRLDFVFDPEKTKVLGPASIIFGLVMYSSTLPTIMHAYKTRRTDTLPFGMCTLFCLNAIAWFAYAFLYPATRDYYIAIAHAGGIVLGLVQLNLCLMFWARFQKSERTINQTSETVLLIPADLPTNDEANLPTNDEIRDLALFDPLKLMQTHDKSLQSREYLERKLEYAVDVLIKWKTEAEIGRSRIATTESAIVNWKALTDKMQRLNLTLENDLESWKRDYEHMCAETSSLSKLLESKDELIPLLRKQNSELESKKESNKTKKKLLKEKNSSLERAVEERKKENDLLQIENETLKTKLLGNKQERIL